MQRAIGRSLAAAFVCVLFAAGCVTPEPMMLVEPSSGAMGVEDELTSEPVLGMDSMGSPAGTTVTMEAHKQLQATVELLQVDVVELQIAQNEAEVDVSTLADRVEGVETGATALSEQVMERLDALGTTLQGMKDDMVLGSASGAMASTGMPQGRDVESEVALAVDVWRAAWEKGDLASYMALYDEDAVITRINISDGGLGSEMDLAPSDLRSRMERLSRQYDRTDVVVRGFRVMKEGSDMAATFEQEFSAFAQPGDLQPIYADKGVKTLLFAEKDGRWLIVEENWAPLRR